MLFKWQIVYITSNNRKVIEKRDESNSIGIETITMLTVSTFYATVTS